MNLPLENKIKEVLKDTKKHCDFKRAWIPRGWTVVHIARFAHELTRKLEKID